MHVKLDDYCTFCNEETEDIIHLFTDCDFAVRFWYNLKTWLIERDIVSNDFAFDNDMILFGVSLDDQRCINKQLFYFVLVAKYFIYKCRCEETLPTTLSFFTYFGMKINTERYIAKKNNRLDNFENEWYKWNIMEL